jgi:anti-sigma factor RsiW
MNNQEAKLILQAYRPDGQDASDPLFAEALAQVARDPELQKWFTAENALEAHIQARVREAIPVPARLKSNLLAMRKIARPAPWWLQPLKLSFAAAVLLLLGLAAFRLLPHPPAQLAAFRETMARYSLQEHGHIVFESHDMAKIQQWFEGRGIRSDFELPPALPGGSAEGCRVVDWNGRKATMICFVLAGGEHLDLFVVDHDGLPDFPEGAAPQFAPAHGMMTATWSKGGEVYLLTGDGDKKSFQKLLQQT